MLFLAKRTLACQAASIAALWCLAAVIYSAQGFRPLALLSLVAVEQIAAACAASAILDSVAGLAHRAAIGRTGVASLFQALRQPFAHHGLWGALGGGLLAGLGEEPLFRGALQPALGLPAVAILFAMAHMGPRPFWRLFPWTLVEGLWFGWLYLVSGNLIVPMATHAAHDAAGILAVAYAANHPESRLARLLSPVAETDR